MKEATRFTGGHIVGHANDKEGVLATSALVFELVCHHGGPRYILRIDPVAGIKGDQLEDRLLEVWYKVKEKGGTPVSLIYDNCPLNQRAYVLLGGPGDVRIEPDGYNIILTYDYDHVHKNVRNNWITVSTKELMFSTNHTEYVTCWKDIETLYNEDRQNPIRLTKWNHTSVNPKPL